MNNAQYQPTNSYSSNFAPSNPYYGTLNQPSKKRKFAIIGAITVAIVCLITLIVLIIVKNQGSEGLPAGKQNTATLQIYAALNNEIPIEEIESVVKNINGDAKVTIDDGYGAIELSSGTKEFISFYFETEESLDEDLSEDELPLEPDEYLEENNDYVEKIYAPNVAYGFTYVHPIDDENAITISDSDTGTFYYYDGLDVYEFPTKREAIEAYLAPVLDE